MARPLKKLSTKKIIAHLTRIRGRNNRLWMALVELAATSPRGLEIFEKIARNDAEINKWMQRLPDAASSSKRSRRSSR